MSNKTNRIPIVLFAGHNGRAVLFGRVEQEPTPGQSVTLYGARMAIRWTASTHGALGLAVTGPAAGSYLSPAAPKVVETTWQEYAVCTDEAAQRWEEFEDA